jgi:alanine-synthesizing transaminase
MFSRRTDWRLAPNQLTVAHQELLRAGREVLDLTISNPTHAGFSYNEAAILDSFRNPQALDYDPQPKGLLQAREAVSGYYEQRNGDKVDHENIFLTTSTSEGYSYVFRLLCNPGDEVLVPKPSYPLFEFLADLQDVKLVPFHLVYDHGWQIEWQSLHDALTDRTRAIVMVHPNNPTGSYVQDEETRELNRLCSERGLALIVDEVFLDYTLESEAQSTFATNNNMLTLTLSGLSKISALPQMKFAWIAVSGPSEQSDAAKQRLEIIADTFLSLNAPVQLASKTLLSQRKEIGPQIVSRLRANLAELDRQLARQKLCTRLAVEAGWYVILRVPVTGSDEGLAIELLRECCVSIHPGHFYDFPNEGHLVLSLITPEAQFSEGVARMLHFIDRK